jgi:hypothetical protein
LLTAADPIVVVIMEVVVGSVSPAEHRDIAIVGSNVIIAPTGNPYGGAIYT